MRLVLLSLQPKDKHIKIQPRNDKFSYVMEQAVDDKRFQHSDIPFPFNSPIGERMTMGDLCYMGP